MHLLDQIETQLVSNRLPLVAVTVAAVPYANTPVVLTLHWHGFVENRLADVADAEVVSYQAVPSSALQLNERWDRLDELENEVLDVAWELGSWDLARTEALPFVRPGAPEQESLRVHERLRHGARSPSMGRRPWWRRFRIRASSSRPLRARVTCSGSSVPCAAECGPRSPRMRPSRRADTATRRAPISRCRRAAPARAGLAQGRVPVRARHLG